MNRGQFTLSRLTPGIGGATAVIGELPQRRFVCEMALLSQTTPENKQKRLSHGSGSVPLLRVYQDRSHNKQWLLLKQ